MPTHHPGASETTAIGQLSPSDQSARGGGPEVEITYYTDPLCAWSWALEPQWRRLRFEFSGRLAWRYVLGGMIADWQTYHDPLNAIHNPSQMGPQWYQVRQISGMPLDERIWHEDPPASSYPACLAVKAAERQGPAVGEAYLRRLREVVMLGRRNVARAEVLLALAEELADDGPRGVGLDVERFRDDLVGPAARDAFQEDLRETRYRDIGRFPTLVLRAGTGPGIALMGYRPYEILRGALARVAPDLRPLRGVTDVIAYLASWSRATDREVAEALGLEQDATRRALEDAVAAGALDREETLPGCYRIRDAELPSPHRVSAM